jgi:hypothetical protein
VELLAVEHRGDLVLGDEHLLVRAQPLGELVEGDAHLGADVGDEVGVEHERLARAAQRLEGADLDLKKEAVTGRPWSPGAKRGVMMVSSGDNFLAGPEFNAGVDNGIPFYDTIALDLIGYDAIAIGNHDFDFGPDVLADFISGFSLTSRRTSAPTSTSPPSPAAGLRRPRPHRQERRRARAWRAHRRHRRHHPERWRASPAPAT